MNAQSDLRRSFTCPSCEGMGVIYTSRYGGNDPDTYVDHECADCTRGIAHPELARAMQIQETAEKLVGLIREATLAQFGDTKGDRAAIAQFWMNTLEPLDALVSEDAIGGVVDRLRKEPRA